MDIEVYTSSSTEQLHRYQPTVAMKFQLILLLGLAALALARPDNVFEFEGDDQEHEQEGEPGSSVEGTYSWTSPEGEEFFVKYVADEDGYRVVESNAVPVSHDGVAADGNQGSFDDDEGEEGDDE